MSCLAYIILLSRGGGGGGGSSDSKRGGGGGGGGGRRMPPFQRNPAMYQKANWLHYSKAVPNQAIHH